MEWARAALIFEKYKCSREEFAGCTEKQLNKLYLHPRDPKTGAIIMPGDPAKRAEKAKRKLPDTLDSELNALRRLSKAVGGLFPPQKLAEAEAKLREKYRRLEENGKPNG